MKFAIRTLLGLVITFFLLSCGTYIFTHLDQQAFYFYLSIVVGFIYAYALELMEP